MDDDVRLARQGDSEAFARLYGSVYQKLYRIAFFVLRNKENAEDAVMDTVADAWQGIRFLREDGSFEAWICRILNNKARRLAGRVRDKGALPLSETIESSYSLPEDSISREDLRAALDSLTAEERAIIAMCVCEDYSSADAADILSLKPATLRSKQARALTKLRERLGRDYNE